MAFSSCLALSPISSLKIDYAKKTIRPSYYDGSKQRFNFSLRSNNTALLGQQIVTAGAHLHKDWSFVGGSKVTVTPKLEMSGLHRKSPGVYASWLASSQIASTAFTLGTTAVLPFYGLMVLAPKAGLYECRLTKTKKLYEWQNSSQFGSLVMDFYLTNYYLFMSSGRHSIFLLILEICLDLSCLHLIVLCPLKLQTKASIESSIPYIVLGLLYAYLLYLSWTPETIRLIFASQYWLPELPGMAKMFSNEMTLASAWIHLLVVDLFAARQIFREGLENQIETRHSISLCLFFCPIGILTHIITKALTESAGRSSTHNMH